MNVGSLFIQLTLLFQALPFEREETTTGGGLLLDPLPIFQTDRGCFLFSHGVCATFCIGLPHTHPTPHELGTERLADQRPSHKEIDDRDIPPVVVDLKFFPPQLIKQTRADVAPPQKGNGPMRNGVAPRLWILAVHRFHEEQLQVVW
jgi:hypothetical protein